MKQKLLLLLAICMSIGSVFGQTTVTTTHTNNNGNGSVIFNVQNTNVFDVIITDVQCHLGTTATNNLQLLYRTVPFNDVAAPWDGGMVGSGQNGWLLAGSATVSNSNTANGIVPAITGMSVTIPAGLTYQFGFSGNTIQYMTLPAGSFTATAGGVNINTGDGISWGGVAYPATPANYPRGFIGGITFVAAVPCSAPPTAGSVTAANNPICPSTNNSLSITGGTGGTGQTYQWQSSADGVTFADIVGATNSSYISNQTSSTYYRFYTTCSGMTDTSAALLVNLSPFTNCYCNSISAFDADEEIYNVTVNGGSTDLLYANANGCTTAAPGPGSILGRYSNFKTLAPITSVAPGQTVNFSIVQDECDGATYYANGIAVWIDFNQNGLFTDPGEQVFVENATATGPRTINGSFTVPTGLPSGNTAMRIISAEGFSGAGLQPCMTYNYGETEDHLITISCPTLAGPTGIDAGVCSGNTVTLTATVTNPNSTITWWDAATGGTQVGSGSTYTTPPIVSNTSYFAQEDFTGCPSSTRDQVNVTIVNVDVVLNPIAATCNGLNNGSFSQGTVNCGTAPFTYAVNGGAFGPIPTNLVAGTYSVVVQDASMSQSVAYPVTITQPGAPTALNVSATSYFTATLGWTASGSETSWTIEYGPTGFTAGSGTSVTTSTNPTTITGLTEATNYQFYVAAACAPGSAPAGPFSFSTDVGFFTNDNLCGPGFTDISTTGTGLNLADDATIVINLTNPISVQGVSATAITVSNNGFISFGGVQLSAWQNDWDAEEGNVFWQETTIGTDNYFIVEWFQRPRFSGVIGQNVTFEILVNQTNGEVYYIYNDVVVGGTQASNDYGAQGTIAATGPVTNITVSNNNATYLTNNSCVRFYSALCPNITNFISTVTDNNAIMNWNAGLYNETNWTLVYGPAGFDPMIPGQEIGTFALSSTNFNFGSSLNQLTTYDVYIYSECQADNITSDGYLYTFTTLPRCSNPTAFSGVTGVDSLDLAWSWTQSSPSYPIASYNITYAMSGTSLYSGTEVVANGLNTQDTIVNAALLSGGVYEVYVQAVCGTGDTSNYVGPITLIMPLTNDLVCGAELLTLATNYTFNNLGATVSTNETTIAPPATGAQTTTGWANSALDNTTWFTFVAPSSGSVRINNTAINYDGQTAVYQVANCSDFLTNFNLVAANDNAIGGTSLASNFTICGLNPGSTYYMMHDGTGVTGNYSISVTAINLNAGTPNSITQICSGAIIDLNTTVTGNGAGGVWSSDVASANASITGSSFNSNGLAFQTFDFEYTLVDGCASDSVTSQVQIFAPSSVGTNGTISACRNEPIDLFDGLNGNSVLNGTWFNSSNVSLPSSSTTTSNTPGTYNFYYVGGNGVCPNDTASAVVTVLSTCDFLTIQEAVFTGVEVYPNPSEGIVFIDANQIFTVEVTDAQGRLVLTQKTTSGLSSIDLNSTQVGIYFIQLSNETAKKVYRIVVE